MANLFKFFSELFSEKSKGYDPDFNWRMLQKIDYISIVRVLQVRRGSRGGLTTLPSEDTAWFMYKLELVVSHKNRKIITVYRDYDKKAVFVKAFEIKKYFNCRIFDCSEAQKMWID
jgi:hypothetical protein